MEIESLRNRLEIIIDEKLSKKYGFFWNFFVELESRDIFSYIIGEINEKVSIVNVF